MRDNESSAEYLARLKAEVAAEHKRQAELAEARKAAGLPERPFGVERAYRRAQRNMYR